MFEILCAVLVLLYHTAILGAQIAPLVICILLLLGKIEIKWVK